MSPPPLPVPRRDGRSVRSARLFARWGHGPDGRLWDNGSITLEACVILPALLLLGGLIFSAGRIALARQAVEQAAWEAAREASIARTAEAARFVAVNRATELLRQLGCQPAVTVDLAGFSRPVGQAAEVSAAVACTVELSALAVPGLPGQLTLHALASSPLDRYRER